MSTRLGRFRAAFLVVLCCIGSFMFSYDTGVVGGVLTMKSFMHSFNLKESDMTAVGSNATSLLQAGGRPSSCTRADLTDTPLIMNSVLLLLLRLAVHRALRPSPLPRPGLGRFYYRRNHPGRPDRPHRRLLCGPCDSGDRCRDGNGHGADILCRDGSEGDPWPVGELVSILLHRRRHDLLLGRLRRHPAYP